jgi:glycosyltransferase involved in cell wall biosynthesis
MSNRPKFSTIIPIYNEEDSLVLLHSSLKRVMDQLGKPYEMIFIDDGSSDGSLNLLQKISRENSEVKLIPLKKRSGKSAALQAGFDAAQGDIIFTMDGDLQNDPEDIHRLLMKMKEGYDVVCGWRKNRQDPRNKKIVSKIANYIRRIAFQEKIHDVGCSLRVYKASYIKKMKLYGQRHRYLTVLLKKEGARMAEVEVLHHPRMYGKSKYDNFKRLFGSVPDFLKILFQK